MRTTITTLLALLVFMAIPIGAAESVDPNASATLPPLPAPRTNVGVTEVARGCIECHNEYNPGLVGDWATSRHAHSGVTCIDCHRAGPADSDINKSHLQYEKTPISAIVSPRDCSRCHPREAAEYDRSKHARTLDIIWKLDPWLNDGMNNTTERVTGCDHCHGSIIKANDGQLDSSLWPNVGVGRLNPDGSRGSCSSCHTRHKFSIAEARKPGACGQCHLGPDHPQVEIFKESKHGAIYEAQGDQWNWDAASGIWTPQVHYRSPTCSVCHMSAINGLAATHDVTERLAWETQAPLTVRPSDFKPLPAKTDWKTEREKMTKVCLACHSAAWTKGHFEQFDAAVTNYNEVYYKPMKQLVDQLYEKKLLSKEKNLDERLEIDMYELWHHEGRRARFGAAMMAPDYAWWHGFYELKKRCMEIEDQAAELLESGKPATVHRVKGADGPTTRPAFDN